MNQRCFPTVVAVLVWSCFIVRVDAGTLAYWELDHYEGGVTPAAVGGEGMALRSAGGGADFAIIDAPAVAAIPNPDSTAGFSGDAASNGASLRCPGNPVENRFLATAPGTNVLRLDDTEWTFEGWLRFTGDAPDGFGDVLLTTRDEPNWCGFTLMLLKGLRAGDGLRLAAHFEVKEHAAGDVPSTFGMRTDGIVMPGTWHHIAMTWDSRRDGPAVANLFVDGVMVAHAEAPPEFDPGTADRHTIDELHIGSRQGSERNTVAGDLDELRISDRVLEPVDMLLFPNRPGPLPCAFEVARRRALHSRTPRSSDVLMRTLRWRPPNSRGRPETMGAMDTFHVTGLVWSYIHDPAVISQVLASGRFFQGAVTNSLSTMRDLLGLPAKADEADAEAFIQRYACLSLDGSANEQPWKRHWPNPFSRASGCCSNPEFEEMYVRALQTYTRAGATMIQRDEGIGNAYRPNYGGCFCDHCIEGFRAFLAETRTPEQLAAMGVADVTAFDYREQLRRAGAPVGDGFMRWDGGRLQDLFVEYQHRVSVGFMARTRAALNEAAGFEVAMSCNNGVRNFDEIMQQYDWFFGELARVHATPAFLYSTAARAAALDRLQIVTMPKKGGHSTYDDPDGWERHTRQTIATSYAVGGICMVPWDVYMPNTFDEDRNRSSTPRYFGKAEDYADLFAFIRASSAILDGYEDAAAIGPGLFETRWGRGFPVEIPGTEHVYAFVRALPGEPGAPVVIHVVDWRDQPQPVTLRLRPKAFFESGRIALTLVTPAPYDAAMHAAAESEAQRLRTAAGPGRPFSAAEAAAYAPLVSTRVPAGSPEGEFTAVELPSLTPWGIVVVREATAD
jgi:hypothetical protein